MCRTTGETMTGGDVQGQFRFSGLGRVYCDLAVHGRFTTPANSIQTCQLRPRFSARVGPPVAAREWLERPGAVELDSLTLERYLLACRVEDTLDLQDRDFLFASALLAAVIPEVLRFACRRFASRIPRDMRSVIERIDRTLGICWLSISELKAM
jgi:hypothetical protein